MTKLLTRLEAREQAMEAIAKEINDRFSAANAASGRISAYKDVAIPMEELRQTAKTWMPGRQALTEERMGRIRAARSGLDALYKEMAQVKSDQEARPQPIKSVIKAMEFDLEDGEFLKEHLQILIDLSEKRLPLTQESIDALPRMKTERDVSSLVSNVSFDALFVYREMANIEGDLARETAEFQAVKAKIVADEQALAGGYHPEQFLFPDKFDMALLQKFLETTDLSRIEKEDIVTVINENGDDPEQLASILEELRLAFSPY